jgi:hypothetical protein
VNPGERVTRFEGERVTRLALTDERRFTFFGFWCFFFLLLWAPFTELPDPVVVVVLVVGAVVVAVLVGDVVLVPVGDVVLVAVVPPGLVVPGVLVVAPPVGPVGPVELVPQQWGWQVLPPAPEPEPSPEPLPEFEPAPLV